MQALDIPSHKGLNAEDKNVDQSLAILKKEDGSDVWPRWTCVEDTRDMPNILAMLSASHHNERQRLRRR